MSVIIAWPLWSLHLMVGYQGSLCWEPTAVKVPSVKPEVDQT